MLSHFSFSSTIRSTRSILEILKLVIKEVPLTIAFTLTLAACVLPFVGTRRHEENQFRNAKPKFTKSEIEQLKNNLYLKFDGNLKDGMS
jgi:hypothetical protein